MEPQSDGRPSLCLLAISMMRKQIGKLGESCEQNTYHHGIAQNPRGIAFSFSAGFRFRAVTPGVRADVFQNSFNENSIWKRSFPSVQGVRDFDRVVVVVNGFGAQEATRWNNGSIKTESFASSVVAGSGSSPLPPVSGTTTTLDVRRNRKAVTATR